ncbi:MAG: hypothetical protein ACFE95_18800 [Candidatus Hodarchaeota archaeon]
MDLIQSEKHFFSIKNLLGLLFISGTLFMILSILTFITMFSNEGGHGMIIVPAIILNREIPEVPIEGVQKNPFTNFPLGIFSLFLAFPFGVIANGFLTYLSAKNAKQYRNSKTMKELVLYTVFISFCILNFSGIINNFFGQDFAFIMKDILKIPSEEEWFKFIQRIIIYTAFPLFLAKKYQLEIDKILVISGTTYLGYYAIVVELIVPPLAPILMANFWWLFIFGLLILACTTAILIINLEPVPTKAEKKLSHMLSKTTTL